MSKRRQDGILITVYCEGNEMAERYQSVKQKRHLEKALHKEITLQFKQK